MYELSRLEVNLTFRTPVTAIPMSAARGESPRTLVLSAKLQDMNDTPCGFSWELTRPVICRISDIMSRVKEMQCLELLLSGEDNLHQGPFE